MARSLGLTLHQFDHLSATERELWIAEWEMKRDLCPDCGNRLEECMDPERAWYSYRRICHATMEREAAEAMYSALHADEGYHDGTFTDWSAKQTKSHPFAAMSGVSIGVAKRDLAPHDKFTTKRDASPLASVAQEPPGEQDEACSDGDEAD